MQHLAFLTQDIVQAVRTFGERGAGFAVTPSAYYDMLGARFGPTEIPVQDLRPLGILVDRDAFWGVMDNKRWVYPYDAKGERRHFKDIPKSVTDLKDDPFRSLAGELRRAGGFAKDTTPFSEFLWADFLRRRMSSKSVDQNFAKAMEKSLALAKSKDAVYLPGWCGPASDD